MDWIKIVQVNKQRVFYINIASVEKIYVDIENKEIEISFLGKDEIMTLRVDKIPGTEQVSEETFSHIRKTFENRSAKIPFVL